MADQLPVYVQVRKSDGTFDRVRVGSAVRNEDGFMLSLGELLVGATPEPARRPMAPSSSGFGSPAGYGGASSGGGAGGEVFPPYGRSKGMPIRGATMQDLEFYANGSRRSLADPTKARFHDKERLMLASIEGEIARQRGGSAASDDQEPPPPSDDDAPPF